MPAYTPDTALYARMMHLPLTVGRVTLTPGLVVSESLGWRGIAHAVGIGLEAGAYASLDLGERSLLEQSVAYVLDDSDSAGSALLREALSEQTNGLGYGGLDATAFGVVLAFGETLDERLGALLPPSPTCWVFHWWEGGYYLSPSVPHADDITDACLCGYPDDSDCPCICHFE